jgi:hypothetical protein
MNYNAIRVTRGVPLLLRLRLEPYALLLVLLLPVRLVARQPLAVVSAAPYAAVGACA